MKEKSGKLSVLPLVSVFPNPDQPRKDFDPVKLEELAMSIREYGVLEPIVVTPRDGRYMIIAGERRFRASQMAGCPSVPARIIEASDELVEELALLENIQRQDLNPLEEARAFRALLERGWTKDDLALKMGFKQTWRVDERMSLLNLDEDFQTLLIEGKISNSQAFEMSRLALPVQAVALKKILSGELGTYNRLRAFVDGLLAVERQETVFALQPISPEERTAIEGLESVMKSAEKFVSAMLSEGRFKALEKSVFHSDVSVERLDLVIRHLQRIRKAVFSGAGVKAAIKASA